MGVKVANLFYKRTKVLTNHFYKRMSNARRGYSNFSVYGLPPPKLLQHTLFSTLNLFTGLRPVATRFDWAAALTSLSKNSRHPLVIPIS